MKRYRTRVAIQQPVESRHDDGGVTYTYENAPGLDDVPATIVIRAWEGVENDKTVVTERHQIILAGYHPEIEMHWVIQDGVEIYDVEVANPLLGRRATYVIAVKISI